MRRSCGHQTVSLRVTMSSAARYDSRSPLTAARKASRLRPWQHGVLDRGDGGGARYVAEQADLAEEVPRPFPPKHHAGLGHLDESGLDDEETVGLLALSHHDLARSDRHPDQLAGQTLDSGRAERV